MPDQFLQDMPENFRSLSPDTRAIVHALYAFERRARAREDVNCANTTAHIDRITEAQRDLQQAVQDIASGFPEGDPDAHRRYHESIIEWRELRNRMVKDALVQASKVGGVAAMGWVAYAIWTALKMEIVK